ncbi:MAG TPA: hypothetical protein PLV45_10440, partial [bacterium]|nr:hypothetical protein [bacterium]
LNTWCFPPEFNQLLDGFRPGDLDRERWLRVLVLKGSYMIRLGRLETARAVFSRHVHESTDPESRMLALLFLAHICSRIDPDAARRYYDTAREQIDAHPSFTQFLYSSLGRFHLTRGELKPAETALDRAMAAEAHPRLSFRSVLLFARVELHLLKGSFADAAACCSDLLNYADTEGDAHLIAQATGLRGRIALATGNPAMALQYLEQSEEMHRRRGNFSEVSRMLGEQAAIHADAGGTDYAIQLYGEALEWGDRAGIVTERRALLHLARIRLYIASENWPAARREWVTVQRLRHRAARDEMIRNELNELSRKIPWESPDDSIDDLTEILDSPVTRKILDHLQRHGRVDSASVRTAIGVGRTSAYLILDRLTRVGLLKRVGRGRATRYLQGPVQSITENPPAARVGDHLHPDAELILNYVNEVGHIAAVTARRITGSSAASVKRRLSELVRSGRLKRIGRGRATRYTVPFETNTTRSSGPGHAEAPTPSISPPG